MKERILNMYEDYIPERLASLRTKKGVSARDMSLTLGQSDNYINSIENKKSLPSMTVFFYICEYLSITPQEFFDDRTINPALLNELVKELKPLDDDILKNLLDLIKKLRTKR